MSCDLTNGRLLDDCLLGRSGIKTLYFTKFNDFDSLTGVVESGGEITSLGTDPINIYQFDMQDNVGSFEEIPNSTPENGTVFLVQNATLTLFYVKPDDLENLNNLKRGRWTIWALDFQDKIRLFGRTRGCVASGGSDVSGAAPGDKKGLDLILTAAEQDYAPFMAAFSVVPFDNFANVAVISGDALGPEKFTIANAASDPEGNEVDGTTPFTQLSLNGTGANVFESQSAVKSVGGFALHGNCNDTPTSGARFEITVGSLTNGATYRLAYDRRHVGVGGDWRVVAESITVDNILTSETSFESKIIDFVAVGTGATIIFIEDNVANDGGIYVDNISLREVL